MDGVSALSDLIQFSRNRFPRSDMLNYRKNGIWEHISTGQFSQMVTHTAAGLFHLGVRRGDMVGITANSSPFWIIADMAILSIGAVTVPIFSRISKENLTFEIQNSSLKYIFIGERTEYDAVRSCDVHLHTLITIGFEVSDEHAATFEQLMASGEKVLSEIPDLADRLFPILETDDLATVIYTSGSTGVPKGVMLSHANILSQIDATAQRFDINEQDIALTSLPFAHIFERMVIYFYISQGLSVYFVDDLANIGALIRDVRPTVMTVVPRLLEKVYEKMKKGAQSKQGLSRKIALAGIRRAETKDIDAPFSGVHDYIFRRLVFKKFNAALGGRFRFIITGAAALPADLGRFFINIGIPLYEGYGMTEASPVMTANFPGNRKIGTVGKTIPGVTVKIADDGEILAKGPNIMKGYLNNPDETARTLDEHGFLHTGDQGSFDDEGFLTITGRKKELFKKSTGEYVPPVPIEQALAKLDIIDIATVIADNRKFVTCLIFPNFETVKEHMIRTGFAGSSDAFLDSVYIKNYIEEHIAQMNVHLHHTESVQRFRIVKQTISSSTGELTPTMKLRRHVIEEKFKDLIDEMYEE